MNLGIGLERAGPVSMAAGLTLEVTGTGTAGGGAMLASTGVGAPAGGSAIVVGGGMVITGKGLMITGAGMTALGLLMQSAANGMPCGGGTSGGNPALPGDPYHPQSVAERIRPRYQANPKHLVRRPGVSLEPEDVLSAYARSIRSQGRTWWSKTKDGFYRFSDTNDGTLHYSGTFSNKSPLVPNHVKRHDWGF